MGWLKIRDKHIALARNDSCLNAKLDELTSAKQMLAYYEKELKRRGMKLIPKSTVFGLDWARMTTTLRRNIYIGVNYERYSTRRKAAVLAHEFVHVKQWDKYRRFGLRYLFSARFGWAMEMQAYRETIRVKKLLGYREKYIEAYVNERAGRLWRGYKLMRQIRRKHLDVYTHEVLSREL